MRSIQSNSTENPATKPFRTFENPKKVRCPSLRNILRAKLKTLSRRASKKRATLQIAGKPAVGVDNMPTTRQRFFSLLKEECRGGEGRGPLRHKEKPEAPTPMAAKRLLSGTVVLKKAPLACLQLSLYAGERHGWAGRRRRKTSRRRGRRSAFGTSTQHQHARPGE